mmetsp:Transcript_29262/g.76823  ORF Transcript_29262/g.76823 Transcript_29262/m.76823 type:complete len:404 (+) Transcript_29262:146-1357(+)
MSNLEVILPSVIVPTFVMFSCIGAVVYKLFISNKSKQSPAAAKASLQNGSEKLEQILLEKAGPTLSKDVSPVTLAADVGFVEESADGVLSKFHSHNSNGKESWGKSLLLGSQALDRDSLRSSQTRSEQTAQKFQADYAPAILTSTAPPLQPNGAYMNGGNMHSHERSPPPGVAAAAPDRFVEAALFRGTKTPTRIQTRGPITQPAACSLPPETLQRIEEELTAEARLPPSASPPPAPVYIGSGSPTRSAWIDPGHASIGANEARRTQSPMARPNAAAAGYLPMIYDRGISPATLGWEAAVAKWGGDPSAALRRGVTPRVNGASRGQRGPKTAKWSANRDQVMELHKELFGNRCDLATPVELPGDNGVSFYRGSSGLVGVMLSAAGEEAAVARRTDSDDDEMWG